MPRPAPDARRARPHWAGEAAVVAALLIGYDAVTRSVTVRTSEAVTHGRQLVSLERYLGVAAERALDLALAPHHALAAVFSLYYDLAHIWVTTALLVGLWASGAPSYRRSRNALVALNAVSLVIFLLWPVAPPRLIGLGFVDVVGHSHTWASTASTAAQSHADQYAAMPSLHVGWALWVALAVWGGTRRRWARWLAGAHVGGTVVVVLATGNHYLLDVVAGAVAAIGCWRATHRPRRSEPDERPAVLLVSASMGAGHDGVARELEHRLEAAGARTLMVDYLNLLPLRIGPMLRWAYDAQLRRVPATYERLYTAIDTGPVNRAATALSAVGRRGLARHVRRGNFDLVVSTYPMAVQAAGSLRRNGRLKVPSVAVLTDADPHGMWLHKGTDLFMAVWECSATEASRRTGRPAVTVGPLLSQQMAGLVAPEERAAARLALDLAGDVVLVVAGSWGAGRVGVTVDTLLSATDVTPVVLCGRNEALRLSLQKRPGVRAVGWTDDVRSYLAAADVVVHNAGGLASLEGFAAGVPVIGHACLPGHGHRNARRMRDAGVAAYADDDAALLQEVRRLARTPAGQAQSERARQLFGVDPSPRLLRLAATVPVRRRHPRVALRRAAIVTALVPALAGGLMIGVSEAAERGFGSERPAVGASPAVYGGALIDDAALHDPAFLQTLRRAHLAVLVPAALASADPEGVSGLPAAGLPVLAVDDGPSLHRWHGPDASVVEAAVRLRAATHEGRLRTVLLRDVGALDLGESWRHHVGLVRANLVLRPGDPIPALRPGADVVLDLRGSDARAAARLVAAVGHRTTTALLPLSDLGLSP